MSLRLEQIDRNYGRQKALDGVNLHVRAGDCYGFIGHNGAGKTTAMRIALGLVWPSHGRVIVDGFDAAKYPSEARARMGALIERPGFFDQLDGRRNLVRLARLQGLGAGASRQEADRLLEVVGLAKAKGKDVGHYSQGMRQRLGIAQALIGAPSYILLDEPGNGLDPEGLAEMRDIIKTLVNERGQTVLMSSHQLHDVEEICNRIGVLKDGHLLLEEESHKIFAKAAPRLEVEASATNDSDGDHALQTYIEGLGFEVDRPRHGVLSFDPGTRSPEDLLKDFVAQGLQVSSFSRRAASLSEIYLGLENAAPQAAGPLAETTSPKPRKAPGFALWRAFRWELSRLLANPRGWALLLLPALLAVWNILSYKSRRQEIFDAAVEAGEMTESITAFPAVAEGLAQSLPLLAIVATMLAAQTLSGELSQGTLRNALLRPVRRVILGLGKFLALSFWTFISYAILAGTTLGLASYFFDFDGLSELLITGQLFETIPREELIPEVKKVILAPLIPLAAYLGLGFFASALTRRGVGAFALALTLFIGVDLGRATARNYDLDQWMLGTHFPSLIADTSFMRRYDDLAQGAGNAILIDESAALWCPLTWLAVTLLLGVARFGRRSVS
ncbi:MAG: ATP-binding cassette domain-containing protein [Planctomycetota bacterium]